MEKMLPTTEISQLGKQGYPVLQRCFDLERIMVARLCLGSLDLLKESVDEWLRAPQNQSHLEHQQVQEKLVEWVKAGTILRSLFHYYFHGSHDDRKALLSLIKNEAVEKTLKAFIGLFELMGTQAIFKETLIQKSIHDLMCLKYLGGTQERHKGVIFDSLLSKPIATVR